MPSALSQPAAAGLFIGVPLLIVLLISGVVVATERWSGRRPARGPAPADSVLPTGVEPGRSACVVVADAHGIEVHHSADAALAEALRLDAACWSARCTECRRSFRQDDQDVHFATAAQAVETVTAERWRVTAGRLRCSTCP